MSIFLNERLFGYMGPTKKMTINVKWDRNSNAHKIELKLKVNSSSTILAFSLFRECAVSSCFGVSSKFSKNPYKSNLVGRGAKAEIASPLILLLWIGSSATSRQKVRDWRVHCKRPRKTRLFHKQNLSTLVHQSNTMHFCVCFSCTVLFSERH